MILKSEKKNKMKIKIAFLQILPGKSLEENLSIGITFLEEHSPKPLNSVIFFDRTGKEILHYSKVHTCAFDLEKVLDCGDDYYTADLDFGRGIVKIGSMICFDREFPESARILMLKGAELILAPNACPIDGVPWNDEGIRDMCVFEAPETPGVYVAELDLDLLRTHRSDDIMGDKYRRPEKYDILADKNVRGVIGGEFVHW